MKNINKPPTHKEHSDLKKKLLENQPKFDVRISGDNVGEKAINY